MEIQEYIDKRKEIYNTLLCFIENTNDVRLQDLTDIINTQKITEKIESFKEFLSIIVKICDNHHRTPDLFTKIEQILQNFQNEMNEKLTNFDIFNIFKNNKKILLFLISNKTLTVDKSLSDQIISESSLRDDHYMHFFYPEIKSFIDSETIKKIENEIDFNSFDDKRQIGENDSYICSLIREDSVVEFITFVNQKNLSLSKTIINSSIFETNEIFIKNKETTLIEYAAFFGSIQIFQYLRMNNVDLKPSLWIYAIHSQNAELIHLLEENHVQPPDNKYESCFYEAIKCHHNEIANYVKENLIENQKIDEYFIKCCLKYHNYNYFPNNFDSLDLFYYLCQYEYNKIVEILLKMKEEKIKSLIILKK